MAKANYGLSWGGTPKPRYTPEEIDTIKSIATVVSRKHQRVKVRARANSIQELLETKRKKINDISHVRGIVIELKKYFESIPDKEFLQMINQPTSSDHKIREFFKHKILLSAQPESIKSRIEEIEENIDLSLFDLVRNLIPRLEEDYELEDSAIDLERRYMVSFVKGFLHRLRFKRIMGTEKVVQHLVKNLIGLADNYKKRSRDEVKSGNKLKALCNSPDIIKLFSSGKPEMVSKRAKEIAVAAADYLKHAIRNIHTAETICEGLHEIGRDYEKIEHEAEKQHVGEIQEAA